jgi:hypothetical protein
MGRRCFVAQARLDHKAVPCNVSCLGLSACPRPQRISVAKIADCLFFRRTVRRNSSLDLAASGLLAPRHPSCSLPPTRRVSIFLLSSASIQAASLARKPQREPHGWRNAFAPFKTIVAVFVPLFRHARRVPFCTTTLSLFKWRGGSHSRPAPAKSLGRCQIRASRGNGKDAHRKLFRPFHVGHPPHTADALSGLRTLKLGSRVFYCNNSPPRSKRHRL